MKTVSFDIGIPQSTADKFEEIIDDALDDISLFLSNNEIGETCACDSSKRGIFGYQIGVILPADNLPNRLERLTQYLAKNYGDFEWRIILSHWNGNLEP